MSDLASSLPIQATGWALVHSLWQGALLALLAAGALRLMRDRAAEWRYAIASGALLLQVLAFAGTWLWLAGTPDPMPLAGLLASVHGTGTADSGTWLLRLRLGLGPWIPWLSLAWLLGSAMKLVRLGQALAWLYGPCLHSQRPAPAPWPARFEALRRRCGVAARVHLGVSDRVDSLVVLGWLKPLVLVPAGAFLALSPEALEALLVHELAHVRRRDFLANLAQTLAEALLFYHPAAWWLSRRIRLEREHCCDDAAVRACGDPVLYASALAGLEELRSPSNVIPDLAPAASGGKLMSRIQRILRPRSIPAPVLPMAALLPALALAAGLGLSTLSATDAPKAASAAPVEVEWKKIKVKHQPDPPAYPPEAKAQRIQGTVVVALVIDTEGRVTRATAVSGPPELHPCAVDYARTWTFHPVLVKGKPVPATFKLTMPFRLR
jgi:TonB family protein